MTLIPENLPHSSACERNQDVILEVISPYLLQAQSALEIGTGSAQHAVYFAKEFPELTWQTSDQAHYLDGIRAQLNNASLENIKRPIELDVNQKDWNVNGQLFDLVYTANTCHIMSQSDVDAFFAGLSSVTTINAFLVIYGPFTYAGKFTSESNYHFDQSLRSRQCGSSIKAFETVNGLAKDQGFQLLEDRTMPANNQCLIWQKA